MKTSHIEILAPAGSFEALRAAINAGADSVFFGIADFNMRASAAVNFTFDNLVEVVELCHQNKVKAYVTVNTVLYNDDMAMMQKTIDAVAEAGADAIIAADMAAVMYARRQGVRVHLSTQLSISNTEAVKFYAKYADVMVLARELTLEQMKGICDDIKKQEITGPSGELVKIEVFAHGALCVAVSGRCGMSLFSTNTSANKGKCSQVCRRTFKVIDDRTGQQMTVDNNYVMSTADLCTVGMMPELVATGISILKFEGRGRPAEYVDTVIWTYKEVLLAIEEGTYDDEKVKQWNEELGTVFNRGLSDGFYRGKKFYEWSGVYGSKASEQKFELGVVEKYYPKIGVVQFVVQAKEEICEGDKFFVIGKTTGIVKGVFAGMKIDEVEVKKAGQGDVVTMKLDARVREKDVVCVVRKRQSLQVGD
jgi:putative protease